MGKRSAVLGTLSIWLFIFAKRFRHLRSIDHKRPINGAECYGVVVVVENL